MAGSLLLLSPARSGLRRARADRDADVPGRAPVDHAATCAVERTNVSGVLITSALRTVDGAFGLTAGVASSVAARWKPGFLATSFTAAISATRRSSR